MQRAAAVEKILDERTWRESTMATGSVAEMASDRIEEVEETDPGVTTVMSQIFYTAAKVLLASVVHGPHPGGELICITMNSIT